MYELCRNKDEWMLVDDFFKAITNSINCNSNIFFSTLSSEVLGIRCFPRTKMFSVQKSSRQLWVICKKSTSTWRALETFGNNTGYSTVFQSTSLLLEQMINKWSSNLYQTSARDYLFLWQTIRFLFREFENHQKDSSGKN